MASLLPSSSTLCAQDIVCALQDWSLGFPQSCGNSIIRSCWPSRSDSLEIPSPFVRSPGWEAWHGIQNLCNTGKTSLALLFSSLWVTHLAGIEFDFIVIVPLLPSCSSFFFVFGHGVSFLGGFQHSPIDDCSIAGCYFGALARGDEHTSFYSTILNWIFSLLLFNILLKILAKKSDKIKQ